MTNPSVKATSSPMKLPSTQQDRNIVADRTITPDTKRNPVNHMGHGAQPQNRNPQHDYAGRLEAKQWTSGGQPTQGVLCGPGPSRKVVNGHPSRAGGWHSHMGISGRAHSFPGRRK